MSSSDLFVYVALVFAWLLIAAWAYRIERKASRLQANIDAAGLASNKTRDAS